MSKDLLVFIICLLLIITFFVPIGIISGLGQQIDNWTAEPLYMSPFAGSPSPIGYSPSQIRTAYNLPSSGGAGTTIAIIDAYDTPNILNYL
jgi:subtilase family serine protease